MKVYCLHDELVPIKDLKAKQHPKNPNKHPKDQIKRLAEILEGNGVRHPIVISKLSGFITKGHGRLEAAIENGWIDFPVEYQDYDSEDLEYADIVADNAIASWAELNLAQINAEIPNLGPDLDIKLLGLRDFELEPADKHADKDADEVPEIKESFVKRGELWILGNHRLLCGDATSKEDVERLMNGEKADMVYTDPPYGIGYEYNSHDDSDAKNNSELVSKALSIHECGKVWTPGKMNLERDLSRFGKAKIAIWYKKFAAAGSGLGGASTFEPILILDPKEKNLPNDVLVVPTERETLNGQSLRELHSCPKPVDLYVQLILAFTNSDDRIAEPFCGSGTTLIACEKTNRKCFGMEIDPHYCGVIIERWQKFTGQKAVRA